MDFSSYDQIRVDVWNAKLFSSDDLPLRIDFHDVLTPAVVAIRIASVSTTDTGAEAARLRSEPNRIREKDGSRDSKQRLELSAEKQDERRTFRIRSFTTMKLCVVSIQKRKAVIRFF